MRRIDTDPAAIAWRLALGEGVLGGCAASRRGALVNDYPTWPEAVAAKRLCACGSSGAAVCGAGDVMAWERGREGAEGVDVDYALPAAPAAMRHAGLGA